MSDEVLIGVAQNILGSEWSGKQILVAWHSGEPTTLPPAYYQNAFDLLAKYSPPNVALQHYIQTNATILTESWTSFIANAGIAVGVSLDGPASFHDAQRKRRSNKGTHAATMRGIDLLRKHNVDFGVICVLSPAALDAPDEIFRFFEDNAFSRVAFNIEEVVGSNAKSAFHLVDQSSKLSSFFLRYLHLLRKYNSKQSIREIERISAALFDDQGQSLFETVQVPFSHISVSVEGHYWTLSPELGMVANPDGFWLGSCLRDHLDDVARKPALRSLCAAVETGRDQCRATCNYFEICGGGSPGHKVAEHGTLTASQTTHCLYNVKAITDAITNDFLHRLVTTEQEVSHATPG